MPAWVSELGVAAQVAIRVVAVWGDKLRAWWFHPKLGLELLKRLGQLDIVTVSVQHGDQVVPQFSPACYYHLRVTNCAVHPEAREVEVLLTQLDFQGPDGRPQTNFTFALPLGWQYYARHRTIGRASVAIADLFFVQPGRLSLTTTVTPLGFPTNMHGQQHFWLNLVARGLNGESKPLRLRIDRDGQWDRGDAEMATTS
jgi:hypothetical protein